MCVDKRGMTFDQSIRDTAFKKYLVPHLVYYSSSRHRIMDADDGFAAKNSAPDFAGIMGGVEAQDGTNADIGTTVATTTDPTAPIADAAVAGGSASPDAPSSPTSAAASSYAARRYGAGGAGGGGAGRVPIAIPPSLQLDMARLALGAGGKGAPTVIGAGCFGTVVLGELAPDPTAAAGAGGQQAPLPVAVKVLDRAKAENSQFMSLQTELDVSAQLRHPCLVNTLGVGALPASRSPLAVDSICIVMELAARGELLRYMKRYGLEDMPEVAPKFVAEAVLALEFMAQRRLAHRDVKPENLLLTQECHVKLSDFGTVCGVDSADAAVFRGTTAYAAPEVLTPGGAVSITTDLWALGCVVYELFVGRPPFQAESDYLLRQAVRGREFEFPPYFPAAARDLVAQLLEVDPAKRLGAAARGGFAALKAHPCVGRRCCSRATSRRSTPTSRPRSGRCCWRARSSSSRATSRRSASSRSSSACSC